MAMTPPALVAVYTPAGKKEMHTKPNARDLVVGAGFSWHPNLPSQPAAFAPFVTATAPSDKPQSQEVVDKVGGSLAAAQNAAAAATLPTFETPDEDEDEDEGDDEGEAEAEAETADEPVAVTEDAPAPVRGRGRRGRGEA